MGYSRRRLFMIAGFWLVLGGMFVLANPPAGTVLAEGSCGIEGGPCMFPAEHYEGGLIFGASSLSGQKTQADLGGFPDDRAERPNSPDTEPIILLGLNDLDVDDFYLYKSWRDYDQDTFETEDYYVYLEATPGSISGTGTCETDTLRVDCDLAAEVTELSVDELSATISNCPFLIGAVCPTTNSNDQLWMIDPQNDDGCGAINALLDSSVVCLGLLDGGLVEGIGADVSVDVTGAKFRTHKLQAQQDDAGNNKVITFNNVYGEIRYGTGYDRIRTSGTNPTSNGAGSTRQAAISNPYDCDGNPDGPDCVPDADEEGQPPTGQNESYLDIYR